MRYVGGKYRYASDLAGVIRASVPRWCDTYLEPFVGGGGAFERIGALFPKRYASDVDPNVVILWRAVAAGWLPPDTLTEQEYTALRHAEPSPLRSFAGFGCSFGGKWFGGFARGVCAPSQGAPRGADADTYGADNAASSSRGVRRAAPIFQGATVHEGCFSWWHPAPGTVIYLDPPYAGTLGYASGAFDHDLFWRTAERWTRSGCFVFVSEYASPSGWRDVWARKKGSRALGSKVERLWVLG